MSNKPCNVLPLVRRATLEPGIVARIIEAHERRLRLLEQETETLATRLEVLRGHIVEARAELIFDLEALNPRSLR